MKKILICILIIIIITLILFGYKYLKNNEEPVQNNPILTSNKENFLLYIDEVLEDNDNVKVRGTILKGTLNIKDDISIVGLGKKGVDSKITKIEINSVDSESGNAGDNVYITLDSKIKKEYIEKGQAIIISGTTKPIYNIYAKVSQTDLSLFDIKEKGNIFNINSDIECRVEVLSEEEQKVKISLNVPMVVEEGIEIDIKNGNTIIAKAIIVEK